MAAEKATKEKYFDAIAAEYDALMEKKLGNDPAALSRFYQPVVQGPARGSAAASSETTTIYFT